MLLGSGELLLSAAAFSRGAYGEGETARGAGEQPQGLNGSTARLRGLPLTAPHPDGADMRSVTHPSCGFPLSGMLGSPRARVPTSRDGTSATFRPSP